MNAPEAARWMEYARTDLKAGYTLLRDPDHFPRHVCYLAQQAAEKALKAILVFLDMDYPYTHDLDRIRETIPAGWQVKTVYPKLYALTIWAVETRYPAEMPDIVETDARQALEMAEGIYQLIETEIAEKSQNPK
ncbi:MAG: HEPN domain-containing protein [Anaerolineales bacterium]|nr:HEPN domain-containing protein [Anaerolineales bacterium]